MFEEITMQSPLAPERLDPSQCAHHINPGQKIEEVDTLGHLNLRGQSSDHHFIEIIREVSKLQLPIQPNTVQSNDEFTILWLGPDEWLLLCPKKNTAEVFKELNTRLQGKSHYAINDISFAQSILRIQGEKAAELLAKGCTLDLHNRVFTVGQCAQTHVAKTIATLYQVDLFPTYHVIVRRSFANYLWRWFVAASYDK